MHEEVALRYSTFVEYINPVNATWGGGLELKCQRSRSHGKHDEIYDYDEINSIQ